MNPGESQTVPMIIGATVALILTAALLVPLCFPQEDDNTLDVVIIDGQSNAQYWGWNVNNICSPSEVNSSGLSAPSHNLYYYGDSTPTYYGKTYTQPSYDTTLESYDIHLMYQDDSWIIGGYGPLLAKELSERSGHDVLIIDVGVGAAPMSWLTSTGPGGVYADRVISSALNAVPDGYYVDIVGMVWLQGESDYSTSIDTYIDSFMDLYDDFNSKFGLENVYIVKTRESYGGNATLAQEQIAAEYDNIIIATDISDSFTEENGYLNENDGIHYSQAGRSVIAGILGEMITYSEHNADQNMQLAKLLPVFVIVAILSTLVLFIIRPIE